MPRLPYKPFDLQEPAALVEAIRKRRGGRLMNLDRLLLYSPPLAEGWNYYLGRVRTQFIVSPKLRELAMCAVAVLNGAHYEFHHHAPELIKAGGTQMQVDALAQFDAANPPLSAFDVTERAVLQLTREMTRGVKVSDATFAAARLALVDEQRLVEIIAVIAAYNMVSRFLVALQVEPE